MDSSAIIIPDIHIGNVIDKVLIKKKMTQADFSKLMLMPQSNISRLLKRKSMDINKLIVISMKLEYNFFEEYCGREDMRNYNGHFSIPLVHIGESIRDYLKVAGISQTEFARLMGIQQPEASRLLKRTAMDTSKLKNISILLQHNFFEEYCVDENVANKNISTNEYTTPSAEFQELLARFESLTIENVELKARIYELEQRLQAAGKNSY